MEVLPLFMLVIGVVIGAGIPSVVTIVHRKEQHKELKQWQRSLNKLFPNKK